MKLYAILQALLGILVADAPVKTIEHVDKDHMVLVTETHRVTVTVEKLPQTIMVNGFGSVTNWIYGDSITVGPLNQWRPLYTNGVSDPRVTAEDRPQQ